MDIYIESFINAIKNRVNKEEIICNLTFSNLNSIFVDGYFMPKSISAFYEVIHFIEITFPRKIIIMSPQNMILFDERYLCFSIINETEKICFDISRLNNENEWDIINFNNNFLITTSFKSYITNKLWAWIDRQRHIWKEEFYR